MFIGLVLDKHLCLPTGQSRGMESASQALFPFKGVTAYNEVTLTRDCKSTDQAVDCCTCVVQTEKSKTWESFRERVIIRTII
jgi:hypothetical protein